nr:NAD-dependent epimerase/dehydratase family protein [Pseudaminobacter salicylatoxidans]
MPAIMHGDGSYIRSWLHVDDTINGILTVIEKGSRNQIYNIGSTEERRNIDVLRRIAGVLGISENAAFVSVADRSGQDVRYSLDDSRLRGLGWSPRRKFDDEIIGIVEQLDNSRFI